MKQIIDRLTRSSLVIVAIWMIAAALLSLAAVGSSFLIGHLNATRMHVATEEVMKTSFEMTMKHRSLQDTANALAAIGRKSGLAITVFDESGRRLVGDEPVNLFLSKSQETSAVRLRFEPPRGLNPDEGAPPLMINGPPAMGYMTSSPGIFPLPFGDFGSSTSAVKIPNGVAFIRLSQSSATFIVWGYIVSMILLLAAGIVLTPQLQRRLLKQQLEPLASVESALGRLSEGDYSKIELVGHPKGTATIVEAYNACADRLSAALKRQAETESNMRQFVAEAGHELRTPLTVLMGFVEVLQDGAVREFALAQRILESVAIEGQRMRALILKLLLLARLDAATGERSELVDVGVIAREVVTGFQALPGGQRISFSAEPRTFVNATGSEIRELTGNLLDNALKHAPGCTTTARVSRVNGVVELLVADDGPGMSADIKARAFERFTRGDESGSVPGSGLGLAIVKRIVDRTKGTIELDTAPGKGTRVFVRIPAVHVESD